MSVEEKIIGVKEPILRKGTSIVGGPGIPNMFHPDGTITEEGHKWLDGLDPEVQAEIEGERLEEEEKELRERVAAERARALAKEERIRKRQEKMDAGLKALGIWEKRWDGFYENRAPVGERVRKENERIANQGQPKVRAQVEALRELFKKREVGKNKYLILELLRQLDQIELNEFAQKGLLLIRPKKVGKIGEGVIDEYYLKGDGYYEPSERRSKMGERFEKKYLKIILEKFGQKKEEMENVRDFANRSGLVGLEDDPVYGPLLKAEFIEDNSELVIFVREMVDFIKKTGSRTKLESFFKKRRFKNDYFEENSKKFGFSEKRLKELIRFIKDGAFALENESFEKHLHLVVELRNEGLENILQLFGSSNPEFRELTQEDLEKFVDSGALIKREFPVSNSVEYYFLDFRFDPPKEILVKAFLNVPELVTHSGKEVSFYPQAPIRKANKGELAHIKTLVQAFSQVGVNIEPNTEISLPKKLTIYWKYKNNEVIGSSPAKFSNHIIYKPEEGLFLMVKEEGIEGVSAVELENLYLFDSSN